MAKNKKINNQINIKLKKIIILLMINLIMCNLHTVKSNYYENENEDENNTDSINVISEISNKIEEDTIKINSKYAIILDRKNQQILYEKNSEKLTAMASTTKIMTALIVIENTNLKDIVSVSKKAAGTGGSRLGLKQNDKISVNDLLYGLLMRSGNDAAIALAEHTSGKVELFAELMNKKAKELKLEHTNFVTPHGLDNDRHYTNARELALLTNYALENKIFKKIVGTKIATIRINNLEKQITNTNELLGNYEAVYGVKTGFTNKAGRCLVTSIKINDMDLIIVVLGADTKKDRTVDSIKLIKYVRENFYNYNLKENIYEVFEKFKNEKMQISVVKGLGNLDCSTDIKLEEIKIEKISLKKEEKRPQIYITVRKKIDSPLEKNSIIGKITIKNEKNIIEEINIINTKTIKRRKINDYFFIFLENMY